MTAVWLSMGTLRANLVCEFPSLNTQQDLRLSGTIAPVKLRYYKEIWPEFQGREADSWNPPTESLALLESAILKISPSTSTPRYLSIILNCLTVKIRASSRSGRALLVTPGLGVSLSRALSVT